MNQESTIKDILEAVKETREAVQETREAVQETREAVKENREIIDFLKENAATKDDMARLDAKIDTVEKNLDAKIDTVERNLDAKIDTVKNEMLEHVDDFIGITKKQEEEFAATVSRVNRVEVKQNKIIKHLDLEIV
jgi:predicted transcriptional regulator